jgi:hypothetical protein
MNPLMKALFACGVFSAIAVWTVFFLAPVVPELVPQELFFAVLIINTFFSIQFYSEIQPKNVSQTLIDTLLVITYLALAFSFGRPELFTFAALCLFIAAPPKYALMLGEIPHLKLLERKMLLDSLGTAGCAALLGATLLGYSLIAIWAMAVLFALANVYLLFVRPMYKL